MAQTTEPMDTEQVLEQLNRGLELQLRSLLQFTQASGSMFGIELQGVAAKLWEFAQAELEDTRLLVGRGHAVVVGSGRRLGLPGLRVVGDGWRHVGRAAALVAPASHVVVDPGVRIPGLRRAVLGTFGHGSSSTRFGARRPGPRLP